MTSMVYIPHNTEMAVGDVMSTGSINMMSLQNMNTIKADDITPMTITGDTDTMHNVTEVLTSSPGSTSSTSMDSPNKREPDADAIKMFVGQVPKTMEESELKEMFCKYGDIYQLNVLRDKASGQHRGCCFVTFYSRKSAIMAQDELHGRHTLAGMHHPIQMKPADNEKKNVEDRKLFIGMVSKKLAEADIRKLFQAFGTIEDCMILRDTSGVSRGCAFVTYAVRLSALNAIQHMHHSQTMEGCSSPLVVKFADTQKDKDRPKVLTPNNNIISSNPYTGALPNTISPQYLALLQQSLGTNPLAIHNPISAIDMTALHNYHNLQNMGLYTGHGVLGLPAVANPMAAVGRSMAAPTNGTPTLSLSTLQGGLKSGCTTSPSSLQGLQAAQTQSAGTQMINGQQTAMQPTAYHTNSLQQIAPVQPSSSVAPAIAQPSPYGFTAAPGIEQTLSQAYSGIAQYTATFPHAYAPQPAALAPDTPAGKQTEGPDGANLFIYHLPQEFTDMDLLQTFSPFGHVVSSKVFIDKQTNLSKCFGFVSFDNALSAQAAIATMNGFQVGMKRLKVQLKRPKNENKPY